MEIIVRTQASNKVEEIFRWGLFKNVFKDQAPHRAISSVTEYEFLS